MFSFGWSIDHAQFLLDIAQFWDFINVYGILGGLLNLACGLAVYNTVKRMGDEDKDADTSDPDIGMNIDDQTS